MAERVPEWRIGSSTEDAGGSMLSLWEIDGQMTPGTGKPRDRYIGGLQHADARTIVRVFDAARRLQATLEATTEARMVTTEQRDNAREQVVELAAERDQLFRERGEASLDAARQRERADMATNRAAVAEDDARRAEHRQGVAESDAARMRAVLERIAGGVGDPWPKARAVLAEIDAEAADRG